jgi:hypothetical protein
MPAGLKAFAARTAAESGMYSFENKPRELSPASRRQFESQPDAWEFFLHQPPGFHRAANFWVMSANRKQPVNAGSRN